MNKICNKCGIEKDINDFEDRGYKCKKCLSDYNKSNYINKKDIIKLQQRKNRHKRNEYRNKKRKEDILYRLTENIRSLVRYAFKNAGYIKESHTHEILGCSYDDFKIYLESQFEMWMTWENKGLYDGNFNTGWDIDHIEPLFPEGVERTEEDIIRLNHYTNLQPLCSKINRDIKRNRLDFE